MTNRPHDPARAPRIEVHETAGDLATAVAGELLGRLAEAQASGSVPQISLTGGSIAGRVHRELARLSPDSEVDWARVVVWWGDERFVAPDSPDRNDAQARQDFLDVVGVDPANVHPIPSTDDAQDVHAAASAYAGQLREHGSGEFDVMMLGMGSDGHVASLFPGMPQAGADDAIVVGLRDSPKPPPERVSLTFSALNRSRCVWFLVSGEAKAQAVSQAQSVGDVNQIPASGVHGSAETIWFLDRDSASRL